MNAASILLDADIFSEIVASDQTRLEPEMSRAILRLKFSEAQNERMRELADKSNRGVLSEDDRQMIESFRRVGNLLALLQSNARLALRSDNSLQ